MSGKWKGAWEVSFSFLYKHKFFLKGENKYLMVLANCQLLYIVILSYCFVLFGIFSISQNEFPRIHGKDENSACRNVTVV